MNFSDEYKGFLNKIDTELNRISEVPHTEQKRIYEAMRYALCGGGKRVRPVLTAAVCDMLDGSAEDALRVGCAIECIHNYSLIHDDLPCMDDDELRRGRPTCHVAFGEDTALLAGDGLLNLAFELLSDTEAYKQLTADEAVAAIRVISRASGAGGMIGGQVIDLACEHRDDVSEAELRRLHALKTGELIRAAAECGCICAHITDKNNTKYQKITEFSSKLGLAFQIKDDILDVIGNQEILGKPVGSDAECGKTTFVTAMGIENAETELKRLTAEAKNILREFDNSDFLIEFSDYLLRRDY